MRASQQTRTFSQIINYEKEKYECAEWEVLNKKREDIMPTCPEFSNEEYVALIGRFAESHIRYENEGQFWAAFFTNSIEAIPRLHAKLRANDWIRNLSENEVLQGEQYDTERLDSNLDIQNQASNPDTTPPTDTFDPLPYTNNQVQGKGEETISTHESRTVGVVGGISNWKHQLGSQAYNEFLDSYRDLFIKILTGDEEPVYNVF